MSPKLYTAFDKKNLPVIIDLYFIYTIKKYMLSKKNNWFGSQIIYMICIIYANLAFANAVVIEKFPYDNWPTNSDKEVWSILKNAISWQDSIWTKLTKSFLWDGLASKAWNAMEYIRLIINIALWLIWFIALIMIIYWFFMIFFSEEEAGIKNARAIVKWSFIAIILIWLSWTIVSVMFWLISILRG